MKNEDIHDQHAPNVGLYIKVFGALMVLTLVTVAISKFHLPRPQAIGLGLFVACIKGTLVGAIFMHLWGENKLIHRALYITVAGGAIMIIPLIDCAWLTHKQTARVAVAEQHPAEEGHEAAAEAPTKESVSESAVLPPTSIPKKAGKPAKGAK